MPARRENLFLCTNDFVIGSVVTIMDSSLLPYHDCMVNLLKTVSCIRDMQGCFQN